MNNYAVETRRRSRSLLVVEGKHEKDELFLLIFKCFPEMNIDIDDVWIYGTNIYKLYEDIVKEYGNDWAMGTAVNVFLKAVAREHRIPFELAADPFYSDSNMKRK